MVLGLRTKTRNSRLSVQLDYIIHIQEIKPWPPSQSLRTLRAILIQWDYGEKNSGLTNQVVPSLGTGSGVGDGRIEFTDSFKLPVTLMREIHDKGGNGVAFLKNSIEFNLYEPRRDKARSQLLGTAVLDLAEFGIVKNNLCVSVPINCTRTYRNTVQPFLFLKIQPVDKNRTKSSSKSRDSLMREPSMDRNHGESVSALMTEEYAEEAEFTTDDDVSSHSSLAVTSSAAESNGSSSPLKENENVAVNSSTGDAQVGNGNMQDKNSEPDVENEHQANSGRNSCHSSSIDLSSDISWISKRIIASSLQSTALEGTEKHHKSNVKSNGEKKEAIQYDVSDGGRDIKAQHSPEKSILHSRVSKETVAGSNQQTNSHCSFLIEDKNILSANVEELFGVGGTNHPLNGFSVFHIRHRDKKDGEVERIMQEGGQNVEEEPLDEFSQSSLQKQTSLEGGLLPITREGIAVHSSSPYMDISKHGKSVRSSSDSIRINGSTRSNHAMLPDTTRGPLNIELKGTKAYRKETRNLISDGRIQQLENKIKVLEGELREAAAIEVSLYSVVAEHGSSTTKVHAPARRLSRLYLHTIKQNSKSGRQTSAKSAVSGLILVAKACGNDVPRLTFWLSNSIALRVIVHGSFGECKPTISVGPDFGKVGGKSGRTKSSSLKWNAFASKITRGTIDDGFGDWENPKTFVAALEKVEAWIFSRIVESLWWQSFTPNMQSGCATAIRGSMSSDSSKLYRTSSSIDQQQGSFSLELWKKAFREACEKICPVRAGGHSCGCLPVISKLIMEQLIERLDVAMFNAILRESADEIPTDPIADPISDAEVLPVPAGKASFSAGAQLKNAIGNWSRWLTDLVGIDDCNGELDENENASETAPDDEKRLCDASSKSFHLLNALSDLMMLPKDMLLSRTIRKEVCPAFGPPLIRRVLSFFSPDEFCPDPIPIVVLEALNSEDPFDPEEDCITNFPCAAAPIVYQRPPSASVACVFGEDGSHSMLTHSGSSVVKKSQTSDDELDELDSPLNGIITDSFQSSPSLVRSGWMPPPKGSARQTNVRYKLLKEVWMNND